MSGSERVQVSGYVEPAEKRTFKAHAEASEQSLSQWVAAACREKSEREALADDAQRYRVEQRLMALVDDAAERTADDLADELAPAVAEAVLDALVARNVVDQSGRAIESPATDGDAADDSPSILEFGPEKSNELHDGR